MFLPESSLKTYHLEATDGELGIDQVKSSPPWHPLEHIHQEYERWLREHYDWPDRG